MTMKDTNIINTEFKNRNMNIIWNKLKLNKEFKVNSRLNTHDIDSYFSALAMDNESLSEEHMRIQSVVTERSSFLTKYGQQGDCTK